MKTKKDILILIILLVTATSVFYRIIENMLVYSIPYDYRYFSERFENSQYSKGSEAKFVISDYDLYSYAGYYYINGGEVSRVNFENPPLGKYLIGLSIILFRNQLVINVFYAVLYLVVTYWLGIILFKDKLIAAFGVLLLSLDPYLHQVFIVPMLDFPSGLFFLFGLLFFIKGKKYWRYLLSSFFFGVSISVKFFPFFFVAIFCLTLYQFLAHRKQFLPYLLSLPMIGIVYLVSYAEFLGRSSFWEFLRFQWWVVRWRMGNPIVLGNAFQTIFTGSFRPWWPTAETIHSYTSEWSFFIPVLVGLTILSILVIKREKLLVFLYLLIWVFLIYINVGTEGGLKYLSPFYGLFSLFASAVVIKLLQVIGQKLKVH